MKKYFLYTIFSFSMLILFSTCTKDKILQLTPVGAIKINITTRLKAGLPDTFTATITIKGVDVPERKIEATAIPMNGVHQISSPIEVPCGKHFTISVATQVNDTIWSGESNEIIFEEGIPEQLVVIMLTPEGNLPTTVTDVDGNVYNTVVIGTQIWMKENLKVIFYNDGVPIPIVADNLTWSGVTTPAICFYDNDINNTQVYGVLYNWYAVNTGILCPTGWHVPSDDEWKTLEVYLGMSQAVANLEGYRGIDEGGKLKETGTLHWLDPNVGATNSSGFTALSGSFRFNDGTFPTPNHSGAWWSSTARDINLGWSRVLANDVSNIYRGGDGKTYGFSVRCIWDGQIQTTLPTITTNAVSSITATTATCGGNITDPGSSPVTASGVCWNINPSPTIADTFTTDGSGMGSFTSNISSLTVGTTYYVRAYATNGAGTVYGNEISFITSISDVDGNIYPVIQIGTQVWMQENLRAIRYNNGIPIPIVADNLTWSGISTPALCNYNNDANNALVYGALYNWPAINTGIICPIGWHVPSDDDFKTLEMFLGMSQADADATGYRGTDQGSQLKSISGWNSNGNGTNTSGFTALPGGNRNYDGSFIDIGNAAFLWSSTVNGSIDGWYRILAYSLPQVARGSFGDARIGFSVRCLKD